MGGKSKTCFVSICNKKPKKIHEIHKVEKECYTISVTRKQEIIKEHLEFWNTLVL